VQYHHKPHPTVGGRVCEETSERFYTACRSANANDWHADHSIVRHVGAPKVAIDSDRIDAVMRREQQRYLALASVAKSQSKATKRCDVTIQI
jgi:hypothetical protein